MNPMRKGTPAGPVTTDMQGRPTTHLSARKTGWQLWRIEAEKLADRTFTEEGSITDRYSLDSAFDAYLRGRKPAEYVEICNAQ